MTDLTPEEPPTPGAIQPPTPLHQRMITWIATALAVVLIVGGVWYFVQEEPTVRVTDGSEQFVDYLDEVRALILEENNRVSASGRDYASIAFMLPIRTSAADPKTPTTIRHELEGAYLAQYWANRENAEEGEFTSSSPLIRLLIADTGDQGRAWQETVTDLVGRVGGSDRLVAVAGLGSSVDTTQAAVDELTRHDITTFGAVVTSSGLTSQLLARVAPTNADEAGAMIHHLRTTPEWQTATPAAPYKAYLLRDTNPKDSYAADLATAYHAAFPRDDPAHVLLPYQGGFDGDAPAVGNVLASEVNTICALDPHIVFFAGRSDDLNTFLGKLAARPCAATAGVVTVATGDDVDHLTNLSANSPPLWADAQGLSVLYTGLATPQAWVSSVALGGRTISPAAIARFVEGPHSYHELFGDDLEDSHAIMAHDAMITATEATRRARTQEAPIPEPKALVNGLHQINAQGAVAGASGWIYFQNTAESRQWLPFNKAIPVLSLDASGKTSLIRLSSTLGVPPGPPG